MALIMKIFWKIINQKRFKQNMGSSTKLPFFFILNFLKIYLNYNKQKLHSFRNAAFCYYVTFQKTLHKKSYSPPYHASISYP